MTGYITHQEENPIDRSDQVGWCGRSGQIESLARLNDIRRFVRWVKSDCGRIKKSRLEQRVDRISPHRKESLIAEVQPSSVRKI